MAMRHFGRGALGLVVLFLGGLGAPASGQEPSEQVQAQLHAIYADKAGWTPAQRKLETSLLYASRESQGRAMVQGLDQRLAVLQRVASRAGVDRDGMVVVDIRAEVTDELLRTIAAVGGRVASAYPRFNAVRARVPIRRVEEVAALPEVRQIGPRQKFLLNTGSQTSQGDAAHAAASARTTYGINGTGVKVGVLSDGVDSLAARQATNDLPPSCPQAGACVQVVPGQAGEGDEGTAMLEIVHDLAPGAQLYFATAFGGDAGFAANILALKNTYGCDVIVDDVTYLVEGAFQDGVIAQAVTTVTDGGALYFSSAGNSGRLDAGTSGTWEGDWLDSGWSLTIDFPEGLYEAPMHSFNGLTGDDAEVADPLTAASGYITLKWSDPIGASTNDYDMFLVDSAFTTLLDGSMGVQDGTQDPLEFMYPANPSDMILITLWSGAARALRVDTNRGQLSIATAGAVVGHNGSESAVSVAAADVSTAGGGAFTGGASNPVEDYSSDGPRRMFLNPDGSAITPGNVLFGTGGGRELQKPDITAADCVTTTTPGFIPFCGTSAAAPHAAAIAALLLSASPAPSPAAVRAAMTATALDLDPAGWDRNAGAGIAMADRPHTVAELGVAMTGPASVAKGANAVYTITVTHSGLGNASAVQVDDPTPAGLTFVSNAGDCTTAFPCVLGTLATGETRTITTSFAVPSDYSGPSPFINTATVSSTTTDPISANNSSSVSTAATDQADVSINKTGPASVFRGTSVEYTIVVANAGPSSAVSVQVADPTPAGLTFVSNAGDCTTAFPCALETLAAGQSRTITTTFAVPSGYSGPSPFTNTATVSSGTSDPTPANNSSSAETTVTSQADLSIGKTGSASVARGASAVYTIVVTNAGPSDAASVQVADPTPAGLTFVSNGGDCTTEFPCTLGTLAAGQTRTITTTFGVPSGYSGLSPFTNTATVSSGTSDPTPANNSSSAETTVTSQADLAIAKTGSSSVGRGGNAVYTISVANNGPSDAASVQVADPTPAGLTFVSNSGDCTTAFPCALGTLAAGQTRTITTTFAVPSGYSGPSPFTNTATVSSATTDPTPGNDSSSAQTTVLPVADLSIVKIGPQFAARGADLTYTITVTNAGPEAAPSVEVTDPTPAGLTFVSSTGDCTTPFPCALGTVSSGESRTITATFSVPVDQDVSAPIVNTASVSGAMDDPDPGNDSDSATSLFGAFYTVTPCRLVDTREAAWQPALQPGEERTFVLAGPPCEVPAGAAALSVNLTAASATAPGNLRLYPADVGVPLVSTINFTAGLTRANNAIVPASADGSVSIKVKNSSVGSVQFILDVNGYFE